MNKVQLIAKLAELAPALNKAAVAEVATGLFGAVSDALAAGEAVTLPGVGKLVPAKRAARTGRNPATGAAIQIPEKTVVKFRALSAFKAKL